MPPGQKTKRGARGSVEEEISATENKQHVEQRGRRKKRREGISGERTRRARRAKPTRNQVNAGRHTDYCVIKCARKQVTKEGISRFENLHPNEGQRT